MSVLIINQRWITSSYFLRDSLSTQLLTGLAHYDKGQRAKLVKDPHITSQLLIQVQERLEYRGVNVGGISSLVILITCQVFLPV